MSVWIVAWLLLNVLFVAARMYSTSSGGMQLRHAAVKRKESVKAIENSVFSG